jgi:hypothetical protein
MTAKQMLEVVDTLDNRIQELTSTANRLFEIIDMKDELIKQQEELIKLLKGEKV